MAEDWLHLNDVLIRNLYINCRVLLISQFCTLNIFRTIFLMISVLLFEVLSLCDKLGRHRARFYAMYDYLNWLLIDLTSLENIYLFHHLLHIPPTLEVIVGFKADCKIKLSSTNMSRKAVQITYHCIVGGI